MNNQFDAIAKILFADFFTKEFKSSREMTLRLSLIIHDVRKDFLVTEGMSVIFENSYYKELLEKFSDAGSERDRKTLAFDELHFFQLFLTYIKQSGVSVAPAGDSEKIFPDNKGIEFVYSAYLLSYKKPSDFVAMIDAVYKTINDDKDFFLFLIFISNHLEFQV